MRTSRLIPLAAVLAAAALPAPASAALDGTVAYHQRSFDDTYSQLYLARADGAGGAVALTTPASAPDPSACFEGPCNAEQPAWTPDGSRVFFDSNWTPNIHIWSMRPDGTGAAMQPAVADFDGFPDISPDGRWLVQDYDPDNGIFLRRIGTADVRRLSTGPRDGYDTNADFSPDGRTVAFERFGFTCPRHGSCPKGERGYRGEIWLVNIDGSGLRRILSGGRVWGDPHFSPDGSQLLVQAYDDKGNQGAVSSEWVVRPDGGGLRRLTDTPHGGADFSGDWSPDGRHIAYVRYAPGDDHLEIRSMTADGRDESLIAVCDPELFCDFPAWGTYAGPLPARAAAATRARAAPKRASRRAATRFRRAVMRELRPRR